MADRKVTRLLHLATEPVIFNVSISWALNLIRRGACLCIANVGVVAVGLLLRFTVIPLKVLVLLNIRW